MKLSSPVFDSNTTIPSKYTCDGENVNPPLSISNIPVGTKSLALIVDDPDAPAGTWTHWIVLNIDPSTTEIAENSVPAGATQGTTSFGTAKWGGPCPPSGTHRYFFKLFALDSQPNSLEGMDGHILGQAELVGIYKRNFSNFTIK